MDDHELSLTLVRKVTVLGVATRTPTNREFQTFPHIILLSEQEWDSHNVQPPKESHTVEEDISSTVGAVKNQGEDFDFVEKYDNNPENQSLYDIITLSHRLVSNVKFESTPIELLQVGIELQDVP